MVMDFIDSEYCRLCAKLKPVNKLMNLQEVEKIQEFSVKMTRINASTNFTENDLPKTICFVCAEELDRAFNFVISVELAQEVLKDIISMDKVKKEKPCSDNENIYFDTNEDDNCTQDVDGKYEDDQGSRDDRFALNNNDVLEKPTVAESKNILIQSDKIDEIPLSQEKLTWKDYSWLCAYCGTQFQDVDELRAHSMKYHDCCNSYRCTDCNIRKLKLDSFVTHVRAHCKHLKSSCYKCNIIFSGISDARKHKDKHKSSEHSCPGCNYCFNTVEDLQKHVENYYKDRAGGVVNSFPKKSLINSLSCEACKKTFKSNNSFTSHLLTHTERTRDHICEICGKCFFNKTSLTDHLEIHKDEKPYPCKICKSAFKTLLRLRIHVRTHDGHKPFSCEQCGKCFRLNSQLKAHSIIHTDSLPHVCTYCKKGFRFKTILSQHIRQHTGVKPYSCDKCRRDFTNWPNYNKHMMRLHGTNMAKKKRTPEGVYPINPSTGDVIAYPKTHETLDWKKNMITRRKPGKKGKL